MRDRERGQEGRAVGWTGLALHYSVSPETGTKASDLGALNEARLTYEMGTGYYYCL